MQKLYFIWIVLKRLLGNDDALPEAAIRTQAEQLTTKARMMPFLALSGCIIILLLTFDFKPALKGPISSICLASVPGAYVFLLLVSRAWTVADDKVKALKKINHFFIAASLFASLGWGSCLIHLEAIASYSQRALLYGLTIGLMSTAVFTGPVGYAITFWLPVTICGFLSILLANIDDKLTPLVCLASYAILTFTSIIYLNKKMTERAINAIQLEESNEIVSLLLRDFQENSSDWLWETDSKLVISRASPRLAEVLDQPAPALEGFPLLSLLRSGTNEYQQDVHSAFMEKPVDNLLAAIRGHASFRDLRVPVHINDERRWWSLTGKPIFDKSGKFSGYRGVGSDITIEQKSRERITFLARFDGLTNLANRNEFDEVLQQACARSDISSFALLYLDLDDFKTINDTYGHATGDSVLGVVAERLRGCLRDGDVAGRLGGDEFAVLINAEEPAEAFRVANRIIDRVERPFKLDEITLNLGISIGIALAPLHGGSAGALSRSADLALYRAKREGRGGWRLYSADEDGCFHDSRVLQLDLKQALDGSQFFLLFQPIIDISTGHVTGLEALLRWIHPRRGLVMPVDFIPMAEQSGLIGPIGKWVIREACARASILPRSIRVAVNLSPIQLRDETLIDAMERALDETGISPGQIEFEITESVNLASCPQTLRVLQWLQGRGIRVTIDDFGTGYSSLTLLRRFRFGKVKIDQSFIRDLETAGSSQTIVKSIIDLAHDMGMVVTAEGVETVGQMEMLRALGCDDAQGYLFARPLPADQLSAFVMRPHLPMLVPSGAI